jgi:hypothetical protein
VQTKPLLEILDHWALQRFNLFPAFSDHPLARVIGQSVF